MATFANEDLPLPRFDLLNEDEIKEFIDDSDSKNTKKQIKYGLTIFQEFCDQVKSDDFEIIDTKALDLLLSQFYIGARNKKGKLYSTKSMQAIRYGVQRHFLGSRGIDIVKGEEFSLSNKTFKALMVKLKAQGKGSVKHHPPVSKEDLGRMQSSFDLSAAQGLQNKVFLDTILYFANHGMENLRSMRPGDFILHNNNSNNQEYFTIRDMGTKNHQSDDSVSQGGQMHAMPGNPRCPVANLKKYIARLNPQCEWMWQRPKNLVSDQDDTWYVNVPLGKSTLAVMTKKISEFAGCSQSYTNHSLRATSVTLLDHAGYTSRDIMSVSGHRSESSIKNYVRTSEEQKKKMSDTISMQLHNGTSGSNVSSSFETNDIGNDKPSTSGSVDDTDDANIGNINFTDSQLERILNELPNAYPVDLDLQQNTPNTENNNSNFRDRADTSRSNNSFRSNDNNPGPGYSMSSMNLVSTQNVHPQYHFHGCVVNIYHK